MADKFKSIILVIDDSKERQEKLANLISGDYFIISAANCEKAKVALNYDFKRVSVIVLSSKIRGESPCEFVSFLKRHFVFRKIPVLIFCRDFIDDEAKNCLLAGASDVFFEPLDEILVLNRLKNVANLAEAKSILAEIEQDDLTGLYTRPAFLHHAKIMLEVYPNKLFGILAFDFENFKLTNSQYGEDKSNEFLSFTARRLKDRFSSALLGRFGGDQFVMFYEISEEKILERINDIVSDILADAPIPQQVLKIGSYAPADASLPIVRSCNYAFWAIQQIKGVYGRNFAVYDESVQRQLLNDQKIFKNMEKALVEEQFKVFYQPKHETATKKIVGAEALVRWNHSVYGFMSPGQFIPLFEKSGFISKLDSFIIKKVCRDIVRWRENGIPVVPISVNISRRDYFENGWLFEQLKEIDSANIDHSLLHMEVTESLYAENTQLIIDQVKRTQNFGFLIEMDDFGSGYSSLGMLASFPLDIIKLDISFVRNLENNRIVIENIIKMAHSMGLMTIAEGVESEEQFEILKNLGCDIVQGFYFSRPLNVDDFEKYLRKNVCTLSKIPDVSFAEKMANDFKNKNGANVSNKIKTENLLPGAFFSFSSDMEGEISIFNDELLKLFECDSDEEFKNFCGDCFKSMIFPDDLKNVSDYFEKNILNPKTKTKKNKIFALDFRILSKKGNIKNVRDYVRLVDSKNSEKIFYNILICAEDCKSRRSAKNCVANA